MTEPLDRRLVAVVFTDMVGYTALLQADERTALEKRDRYWAALERHHDASEGTIVQRLGDGSMSMFPSSLAAVRAAVAVQRELTAQDVPVRIGIHTGEVIIEPERLTGEAVNVASRIESFATPGGVMLSDSAYEQIRNQADLEVVSLGRFKLKNVGRPFDIYAVRSDGLVVPDATALEGKGERIERFGARLPEAAAPLIGRADDLTALADLAQRHRIVTITGPGGVGKTTVLAELGRTLAPELLGAVAFVSLAEVDDPTAVLPSLAEALDVKEADARAPADGLVALIGDAESLLLLDNLEQVVDAAPDLAALVKRCPALRIVATSRTPLRVAGEQEYPLSPLPLPPPSENGSVEDLLAYPSVALFVERARSAKTAFALTPANAVAVAAVCARLDGLPLALELAAARLRLLSPEALLERLDHALDVLASAQRDLPERQRTLRATIDWSHSLLDEPERRVLRRLSTFVGGCSVEDAEAVCAEPGGSCLDQLESLVDKALVQVDGSGGRLRLLQTVGEFAREQLDAAHEAPEVALRHARRYAQTAQEIRDGIEGTDQVRSVERGIAEEANLQAALDTLLSAARAGDANAAELGMQMSGDLWMYWHVRGKNVTAREVATSFLDAGSPAPATVGEAGALITVGLESWVLGRYEQSLEEWSQAARIAEEIGAEREACIASTMQSLSLLFLDPGRGLERAEQSIERSRAARLTWVEAFASSFAGILHAFLGDADAARARYEEALELQRRIGDREGAGMSLGGLAQLASASGDTAAALDLYRSALAAFEDVGDRAEEARILGEMAWAYLADSDVARARATFFDAVQAHQDVASVRGVGLSLIGLAAAEVADGRPGNAAQIAAAAEVYAQQEGIAMVYADDNPGREYVERARAALSDAEVARTTEVGRRLSIPETLDLARSADTQ